MFSLSNIGHLATLDVQGAIDHLVASMGGSQYVKSVTYLAHDAPAPAGTFVLSLRDPQGEKVEFAIEPAGDLVALIASIGLKAL